MQTLTKAGLVDSLFLELGLNKTEAKQLVDLFFDGLVDNLVSCHPIKLSGLGNFDIKDKHARPGRNPKTREDTLIEARRVVTFRAGQKLRVLLDQKNSVQ
jgi:integration host factor subunit alpha